MMMIRLPNQLHLLRNQNKRLIHKDKKPRSLIVRVDQLTCRAELSKWMKIQSLCHATSTKQHHAEEIDPSRDKSTRAVEEIQSEQAVKTTQSQAYKEYLIKLEADIQPQRQHNGEFLQVQF